MAPSVSQERLLERKPQILFGRPVSQFKGNISKVVKAEPHDISSPFSGNFTVWQRALGIF